MKKGYTSHRKKKIKTIQVSDLFFFYKERDQKNIRGKLTFVNLNIKEI